MSIRGLPDERPRPSVANLIGRFEQRANKRQSSVGPPGTSASPTGSPSPSRSTSAISTNAGDAAQIEVKEKREWPPRSSVNTTTTTTTTTATVDRDKEKEREFTAAAVSKLESSGLVSTGGVGASSVRSPPPPPSSLSSPSEKQQQGEVPSSLSASVESIAKSAPEATINSKTQDNLPVPGVEANKAKDVQPTTPARATATGKMTTSKSTPTTTGNATPANNSASRTTTTRSSAAGRPSTVKSTTSTPNKPSSTPTAKPLSAQRTGTSTGSGGASRLGAKSPPTSARAKTPTAPRASTSGSLSKPTASARAKTPTASPAASRAKTPTAHPQPTRPKTPSSGLYAPTKASLAKARNAEVPLPPVHKASVPSSSLERLMKPTAASKSKVRETPVSPPRASAAVAGGGVKRGGGGGALATKGEGWSVRPRIRMAPAKVKAETEKKEGVKKADVSKDAAAVTSGDESLSLEHSVHSVSTTSENEIVLSEGTPSHLSQSQSQSQSQSEHETEEAENEDEDEIRRLEREREIPSDIESYDDAFASDDEDNEKKLEMLDSARIVSARPLPKQEEGLDGEGLGLGEGVSFDAVLNEVASPVVDGEEEELAQGGEHEHAEETKHDTEAEGETPAHVEAEAEAELPAPSETETSSHREAGEEHTSTEVELELNSDKLNIEEAIANGGATPTPTTLKHNLNGGVGVGVVPETEFDSVLDMLAVKPPVRSSSPGEIPDEE